MNLPSAAARCQSRFVVGVTGHMHFDRTHDSTVRQRLSAVLSWLTGRPSPAGEIEQLLEKQLGPSPMMDPASVLLLTCLAPGVDQIAAEVALERQIPVRAALSFPETVSPSFLPDGHQGLPIYRHASTFRRGTADDDRRIADYDALVRRIGVDNVFAVRQAADAGLSEQQWINQLSLDHGDPAGRRRRYRAAGEYVADMCQLLIAVCDRESFAVSRRTADPANLHSPDSVACADVVIDSHLQGLRPGRLAEQRSSGWVGQGTVVRIFLPRQGQPDREGLRTGDIAVWNHVDWSVTRPSGATEDAAARGADVGRADAVSTDAGTHGAAAGPHPRNSREHAAVLRLEAQNLNRFGRDCEQQWQVDGRTEAFRMLQQKSSPAFRTTCLLQQCWQYWWGWLKSLSAFRRRSDSPGQPAAPAETKLHALARLRRCASQINRAADARMKALRRMLLWLAWLVMLCLQLSQYWVPGRLPDSAWDRVNFTRSCLFGLSLVFFVGSWVWYLRHRWQRLGEQQDDHRALSEAFRVQFFWSAAGTGQLVSQHYLQHQCGGLGWIRAAVSSAALPVSEDRDEFLKLSPDGQRQRLLGVQSGWLEEQARYFEKTAFELAVRRRWLTCFATVLLISGLLQLLFACGLEFSDREQWFSRVVQGFWLLPLELLTGCGVASFLLVQFLTWQAGRAGYPSTQTSVAAGCVLWINRLIEHSGWCTLAGLVVSGVLMVTAYGVPDMLLSDVPSGRNLNQIFRNLCFAGAGLLHAAMSFSFLTRNIAHYSSMADVFRRSIHQLSALLETLPDQGPGREQRLQQIRQLLIAVGVEALNENSDWLQRHRAAPVTPITPSV